MSAALQINVKLTDRSAVLSLVGELDSDTIGSLARCLVSLDDEFGTVVLDLGDLEFIDATALHSLVRLRDELEVRFQRLECRNASGHPARMLEMAGVARSLGLGEPH